MLGRVFRGPMLDDRPATRAKRSHAFGMMRHVTPFRALWSAVRRCGQGSADSTSRQGDEHPT